MSTGGVITRIWEQGVSETEGEAVWKIPKLAWSRTVQLLGGD